MAVGHFFDAGMFIGALLKGDPRHPEALPLLEAARRGDVQACTTTGILCEVYAGLTHIEATPRHSPGAAAEAIRRAIQSPSAITILSEHGRDTTLTMLSLLEKNDLRAKKVHDARHAATALLDGVTSVYTYELDDWSRFEVNGLLIAGPPSSMQALGRA